MLPRAASCQRQDVCGPADPRPHSPSCADALAELLPVPAPFAERYVVFSRHYVYHQARRRAARQRPRPTIGELMMTSHLTKPTCRRYRREFERGLELLP